MTMFTTYRVPQTPETDIDDDALPVDVAAAFQRDLILTPQGLTLRRYRGAWWRWDGRAYRELTEELLTADVIRYLLRAGARKRARSSFVRDVLINIKTDTIVPDDLEMPAWLSRRPPGHTRRHLSLENGIIDIERALVDDDPIDPHSPEFFTAVTLPYPFDADAHYPRWIRTLEWILPEADKRRAFQQYAGYCLWAGHFHQTCLILTGEGSNGKSTVLTLLTKLFGSANVSSVPLDKFEKPFSLYQMLGKLVNIAPDMGEIEKTAEGILKSLISGDSIDWEQKYKPTITAPPTAKLIFACNTLPRFMDRSQGIWRRLLIIPFEVTIAPEQREPDIDQALEAELPGILLWALGGLHDLRQQGYFTIPAASIAIKEELRLESNPARAFLVETYVADAAGWVLRSEAYDAYKTYCSDNNHRPLNERNFGKEVRRAFSGVDDARPRMNGERPRYYVGIRKKPDGIGL